MAFTNNCGTIVIDAVLTDIGRKRMVQGNFKITKYAFGDDEINYNLVDINDNQNLSASESGGTPLGTPIFEAFAERNSVINHGLLAFDRTDLLYLPVLKTNENLTDSAHSASTSAASIPTGSEFYYLSANSETTTSLTTMLTGSRFVLETNNPIDLKIIVESGLDAVLEEASGNSLLLPCTEEAREAFILNTNLLDNYFNIYCDSRFITNVLAAGNDAFFKNADNNAARVNFQVLQKHTPLSTTTLFKHSYMFNVVGIPNLIYDRSGDGTDINISSIRGPRGSATALNFIIDDSMTATSKGSSNYKYTTYGTSSAELFGDGFLYDYIDTTVLVEGATSQSTLHLPIRIIRYAGT